MTSKLTFSGKDYSNEPTSCGLYLPNPTAANIDTITGTSIPALLAAINGVCPEAAFTGQVYNAVNVEVGAKAALPESQREAKWRVYVVDSTGNKLGNWSFEIGMYDSSLLASDGKNMDAGAERSALEGAIAGHCVSRLGNTVTVERIVHVGRNT